MPCLQTGIVPRFIPTNDGHIKFTEIFNIYIGVLNCMLLLCIFHFGNVSIGCYIVFQ